MTVHYDPTAQSGKQYTIVLSGQTFTRLSRADAEALLQREGSSIRESAIAIAAAKLQSQTGTA